MVLYTNYISIYCVLGMDEFYECDDIHVGSKYKHRRTIIHIDLDCFYAQVEILKSPELATKPIGIKQQHYVITSNYVAREYGVKKCMLITEALALCPKLVIINGEDLHDYRLMSSKVTDVIRQFSPKVEKLGLDENFVDISDLVSKRYSEFLKENEVIGHIYLNRLEDVCTCGCKQRLTIGSQIANEIRLKIKADLGLTSCAGVGHNKLLAKLVGPTHKPNQQTTVFPCAALLLMSSLKNIRAIPGIGRKTSDLLNDLGISSISDAQHSLLSTLEKHIGKSQAHWIKAACFGVDDSDVRESGKQQVIGLEEAAKQISSIKDVNKRLVSLVERGMILLQEDGRYPTTIRVSVRKYCREEYLRQRESKQCAINPSLFRTCTAKDQLIDIALSLFKKLVDCEKPFHLTLIGLAFTKFQEEFPAKNSMLHFLKAKFKEVPDEAQSQMLNVQKDDSFSKTKTTGFLEDTPGPSKNPIEEVDYTVLNELPEDIRCEVLSTYKIQEKSPSTTTLQCPPEVDENVFSELPHEIQQELVNQSLKPKTDNLSRKTSKKQKSILNYLKK